jgi:OFA family oxalate/formate antiporter-like MFS transporter
VNNRRAYAAPLATLPRGDGVVPRAPNSSLLNNGWLQLSLGIVGMVAVANMQYGWTFFVKPLQDKFHWDLAQIQVTFTVFVLAETWLVPIEGYLVDRLGPAPMVFAGGLMVGLAWVLNSVADSLAFFYLAAVIGGAGTGIVYGASIGNALKWFPHRRGLAAGLTAAAFGLGSALTVLPIRNMIRDDGYQAAFFWFGLGQGGIVLLSALLLRSPVFERTPLPSFRKEDLPPDRPLRKRDFTWLEMVRTPIFWLMYVMLTMVTMGGLMVIAQIEPMARDFHVADVEVTLLGMTQAALPFAMMLDRVLNGLTRPFFGWISDHFGRENTMFVAFGLEGIAILLLINLAHIPVLFVVLTGLTFFAWGEAFSLFPALCGDLFGRRFATTNYGFLYTAKGTASLLVPLGSLLKDATGSWMAIFVVAIVFDWAAALLALLVLKPLRAARNI